MMHSRPWTLRDFTALAVMLGVGAWAFRSPLSDIFSLAVRDAEQSHILLAPIVAIWLVWLRRTRLKMLRVSPSFIGVSMVIAGAVACWWGFHTDTYIAWHGGALLAMLGMLMSLTGTALFRLFAPAIGALAFMVPVPGTIRQLVALPLQSMATGVTHTCLEMFNVQASRMGNVLIINGEHIAVAEACNGMRLVFALTLVVYAFAFSSPLRTSTRLTLIAISPLLALAANVVRLVPTSFLYGATSPELAERFHDLSGWVMLPLALIALMALLRLFKWLDVPISSYRLAYQ